MINNIKLDRNTQHINLVIVPCFEYQLLKYIMGNSFQEHFSNMLVSRIHLSKIWRDFYKAIFSFL